MRKTTKKLQLNKQTVRKLQQGELRPVVGGLPGIWTGGCTDKQSGCDHTALSCDSECSC